MTDKPLVAAIIPTLDRPDRLAGALESVFEQTYDNIEAIVIDGGETPKTAEVIDKYKQEYGHERVIYIQNEEPQGLPAARNQAAELSEAEFFAFLDDDDRWHPEKIEKQVKQFENRSNLGLSYTGRVSKRDDGTEIHTVRPSLDGAIYTDLLIRNDIGSPSRVMVTSTAFEAVGGFDPQLRYQEDWDFYLRVAKEYDIGCLPDPLTVRRFHEAGMSRNVAQQKQYRETVLERYQSELHDHDVYESAWATHHTDTGIMHCHNGATKRARKEFKTSLTHTITFQAILLYIMSLFGPHGFERVVELKRQLE